MDRCQAKSHAPAIKQKVRPSAPNQMYQRTDDIFGRSASSSWSRNGSLGAPKLTE